MATASPAGLDLFLNNYRTQVDTGFGLIAGDVQATLATLVVISVVITALLWAIDENQNVLASLVRKVLLVGFFAWMVTQWRTLSQTVVDGFVALGLKAGGGAMSLGDFLNSPSKIVLRAIQVCVGLLDYIHTIAPGPIEFFAHIDAVLMALIACVGVLLAFVFLSIEVCIVVIEFHIVTLIAFVTVPFGILTQTAFLSERAIGYVISVGIKLMALAIVVSIGTTIFDAYTVSTAPDINEDVGLLLGAVVLLMLALKIPSIAGALISGGPQLTTSSAIASAANVATAVAGLGLAGRMIGGGAAQSLAASGQKIGSARAAAGGLPGGRGADGGAGSPSPGSAAGAAGPSGSGGAGSADLEPASSMSPADVAEDVAASIDDTPQPAPADTIARAEAQGSDADAARVAVANAIADAKRPQAPEPSA